MLQVTLLSRSINHCHGVKEKYGDMSSQLEAAITAKMDKDKRKKKRPLKASSKWKEASPSSSSNASDTSDSDRDSSLSSSDDNQGGVKFDWGSISAQELIDLPSLFHKNFKKLGGYIPLSVFDKKYLEDHRNFMSTKPISFKRSKNPTSQLRPEGVKPEYELQFSDALSALDLMIRYSKEIYGHEELAAYLEKHKIILNKVKTKFNCWTIALRYDIAIRTAIFLFRKKGVPVTLPYGRLKLVEKRAQFEAEIAGDTLYVDNPYAQGNLSPQPS